MEEPSMPPDRPQHPTSSELSRFLRGALPRPRTREIVRHLLAGCPRCVEEAERLQIPTFPRPGQKPDTRR
jgi:hypothetical protein